MLGKHKLNNARRTYGEQQQGHDRLREERRGEKLKKLERTRKRDTEREEAKQAWNKYVDANIPELKVTCILISCQWKREQYQD